MAAQLKVVSPATLSELAQIVRTAGQVCEVEKNNVVSTAGGALTVKLPATFDDNATVMISDSSGDGSTNPITIDGNGSLIDGATDATVDVDFGVRVFIRDTARNQWASLFPLRQIDGVTPRLLLARDLALSLAAYVNTTVPNLAALAALDASGYPEDATARVLTLGDVWTFSRTSSATADGITVVAATGGGLWLRGTTPNPKWAAQDAWTINGTTGSDENAGGASAPLKTAGELYRRLGPDYPTLTGGVAQGAMRVIRVTVETSLDTANDPIRAHAYLGRDRVLSFIASPTVTASGTITAVTALNRGANQAWEIFSATVLTAGQRLKMTAGASAGAIFYVAKVIAAGQYRVSQPGAVSANDWVVAPANLPPTADTFDVETVPEIGLAEPDVRVYQNGFTPPPPAARPLLVFTNLKIRTTQTDGFEYGQFGNAGVAFRACQFVNTQVLAIDGPKLITLANCFMQSATLFSADAVARQIAVQGGLLLSSIIVVDWAGFASFDLDFIGQGSGVLVNGGHATFGTAGFFDSAAGAVVLGSSASGACPGCFAQTATLLAGTNALYGSGNGVGVDVGSGCTFGYKGNAPTINAAGTNFTVGGAAVARAWDDATGAYTEAGGPATKATTWALLAATIGAGGFGGAAHNVQQDSHVINTPDT